MGNPVVQWQIVAREPDKVASFYAKVFDWQVRTDNALGYRQFVSGSDRGIPGGVWPSPPEGHNMLQLFIEVDDVDAAIAKATGHGATVIIPKSQLPDGDEMAILLDPAGLSFGLVRPRPT
ncbi:MAG TPA: VOC family protein [Thermoanaerobaculia bacterium]|nr:VOC family protein [Thermoanaerobaculia bacterium]